MRPRAKRPTGPSFVLAAAWLIGLAAVAHAQSPTNGERQFLRITEIRIKPESMRDWIDLQKSEAIPMERKAGFAWREVWTSGNEYFERIIVEPIPDLAALGGPNPAVKAIGAEQAAALHDRIWRMVTGVRSVIAVTRPDLGFGTSPPKPRYALLTILDVRNGHAKDFDAFISGEIVPALKKGGAMSLTVVQVMFGDDVNRYFILVPVSGYAEIAKGTALERGLGPEGVSELSRKSSSFVSRVERRMIRYIADLSYGVPAPATP